MYDVSFYSFFFFNFPELIKFALGQRSTKEKIVADTVYIKGYLCHATTEPKIEFLAHSTIY